MLLALHLLEDSETCGLPLTQGDITCLQKIDLKLPALRTVFLF